MSKSYFPKKIICMTEESVEFFHAIGRSDVIAGVSVYAVRPADVKKIHPIISSFTHANIKKIIDLKPDMVIGFSDIQKDIARDLIAEGIDVFISNQRTLDEILRYLWTIGHMIGEPEKTRVYIAMLESKIVAAKEQASKFKKRPKVFIEEWDGPKISGINWFSELVELCGGSDVFREKTVGTSKASERMITDQDVILADPDIILACWCGKKVDLDSIKNRQGYSGIAAVQHEQVIELSPEIFLQPGPAPIVEGIDLLLKIFSEYQNK